MFWAPVFHIFLQTDQVDVRLKAVQLEGIPALRLVFCITWLTCSTRILVALLRVFEEDW